MRPRVKFISIVLLLLLAPVARADEEGAAAERARELRAKGRYRDALAAITKAESPADPACTAEHAELLLETGKYAEAEKVARAAGKDARCRTLAAESLFLRGRYAEALELAQAVLADEEEFARARYLVAELHREEGRREAAAEAYVWFFDYHAMNELKDPEALTLVALASLRLAQLLPDVEMEFNPTLNILDSITGVSGARRVKGIDEDYLPAYLAKAELYLAVYKDKSAKKWLQKALAKNPRYAPAQYWMAHQMAFEWNAVGGASRCEDALAVNPSFVPAREFIAEVRIGDRHYAEAREQLTRALAVNPKRKAARGLLAVIDFLTGDRKGFDRRVKELLTEDPKFSRVYRDLAGALEQQRRFEHAGRWAKEAVETDETDYLAWWLVGRNLVHMAKEEEAKKALEKSEKLDPGGHYSSEAFRYNMIKVLGHLEEFSESRSKNFRFKIHVGENAILSRYYRIFLERSWDMLTEKYGFVPEGPILTEVFHIHADFAALTIGLPGIGALGACFGKVITLDSPSARAPGEFTWASTAHHEFAHVITLQLSKGRVPRRFTEGLSVYEERKYAAWWERDMDRSLYDRHVAGEVYPILEFNAGFRGRDMMFAYYLGGLMCEFLDDEFGFEKIVEMLRAYGEDKQTPQVLQDVLGVSPAEYDERFRKWVGAYVADYRLVPRWSKKSLTKFRERAAGNPKDVEALARIAWTYFQRGNSVDALMWLGRAWALSKTRPDLLALRGRIAMDAGRKDKAREWYEKYLAAGGDDFETRMHLAKLAEDVNEFEAALAHSEAARRCFPVSPEPWLALARMRQGEGDLAGSMAAMERAARLMNTDIPIRMKLAAWYEETEEWAKLAGILTQVVYIYPLAIDEDSSMAVHARLARALSRLKRHEEASLEFEVALELGIPRESEAAVRADLAGTLLLLGRVKDARFHAETALDIDPDCAPAKEVLERVRPR